MWMGLTMTRRGTAAEKVGHEAFSVRSWGLGMTEHRLRDYPPAT